MNNIPATPAADSTMDRDTYELSLRKTHRQHGMYCACQNVFRQDPGFPKRRPLPEGLTPQGRFVWEPPLEDMTSDLIGEHYEKMREAVLEFADGNRAKTTEFLDWYLEGVVNERYEKWAEQMSYKMENSGDDQGSAFFWGLFRELAYDNLLSYDEGFEKSACLLAIPRYEGDGYRVECYNAYAPMWGGDPWIVKKAVKSQALVKQTSSKTPDQDEEEKIEDLDSPSLPMTQPLNLKPIILQLVAASKSSQLYTGDSNTHGLDEQLD